MPNDGEVVSGLAPFLTADARARPSFSPSSSIDNGEDEEEDEDEKEQDNGGECDPSAAAGGVRQMATRLNLLALVLPEFRYY